MRVAGAKAAQQDLPLVCMAVVIKIPQEKQIGPLSHIHATIGGLQPCWDVEAVSKHR